MYEPPFKRGAILLRDPSASYGLLAGLRRGHARSEKGAVGELRITISCVFAIQAKAYFRLRLAQSGIAAFPAARFPPW